MIDHVRDDPVNPFPLSFCLNACDAATWNAVQETLDTLIPAVKALVAPHRPFPLSLHLGNRALREAFADRSPEEGVRVVFPALSLCTDNAAMIARTALFHFMRGHRDSLDVRAFATGSLKWRSA